jgi:hypothetical protein
MVEHVFIMRGGTQVTVSRDHTLCHLPANRNKMLNKEFWESQSQSYVTTDGQSANLSWNKAPIWSVRPDLYYYLTVAGLLMWVALSDERTFCHLPESQSAVVSLLSVCTIYILHVIKRLYIDANTKSQNLTESWACFINLPPPQSIILY